MSLHVQRHFVMTKLQFEKFVRGEIVEFEGVQIALEDFGMVDLAAIVLDAYEEFVRAQSHKEQHASQRPR